MECKETQKYFDDFILGELDPRIEIKINEHLTECKRCKKEFKKIESVITIMKRSKKFEPSTETYRRISSRITLPRKERRLVWGIPKSFVYAVAAFLLGIVVMRAIDVQIFSMQERPKIEVKYEPLRKEPFSDTVQFYAVPVKNLVKI